MGYELFNEPIAPYFPNMEEMNSKLEGIYKIGTAAIREVDKNHIILLGGSQWNGNFKPFKDSTFDDKIMYTCHRYGGEPTKEAIQKIINFRDSVNLPMYMGEIGHNTDEWQAAFCQVMRENNIGYTFGLIKRWMVHHLSELLHRKIGIRLLRSPKLLVVVIKRSVMHVLNKKWSVRQ